MTSILFRALPSVDSALTALAAPRYAALCAAVPRALLRDAVNEFFDSCRNAIRDGSVTTPDALSLNALLPRLAAFAAAKGSPRLRRVLNATGVVLHTNLGRSLLSKETAQTVAELACAYNNLEFDLETGQRGSRHSHAEGLICSLTGAEAALAVNNNAAAVLLLLDSLAKGREVIVSRGQLVEIGGSFRIPEVMEKSGCTLREVGATNRTHLRDYAGAITEHTAALMKVHTSNFRMLGFCKEVPLKELAALAQQHGLPLIEDLGSGILFDFAAAGFPSLSTEPTVRQVLEQGADLVTFSGDKLLGGPQAGIIAGKKRYIDLLKKNPLVRALRLDKMTLAALQATLRLYLDPELARRNIPTLRMLLLDAPALQSSARRLATRLKKTLAGHATVSLHPGASRVGGGAFPEQDLPTTLVLVRPLACSASTLRERLLRTSLPLVGRMEDDALALDPRTLDAEEFPLVAAVMAEALCAPEAQNVEASRP